MIGKDSIIREDVKIGENTDIWHFCNLYGCTIGKNTQIGSYCEIKEGSIIGDGCRFQSYVFVSESTLIGKNVFVGPRVIFLNDKYPTAKKAINKSWKLEKVVVEDEVSIGGNVTILPGVKIGYKAFVGGGSVVTKDVPEYSIVCGNPARIIGRVNDEKYGGLII